MKRNMIITARALRQRETPPEEVLWELLRGRRNGGLKIRRQHPITVAVSGGKRFYVADFYCHEARLVVELDGPIHDRQKERDMMRDTALVSNGYRVLRISNEELYSEPFAVAEKIEAYAVKLRAEQTSILPVPALAAMVLFVSTLFPAWYNFRGDNNYAYETAYAVGTNFTVDVIRTNITDLVSAHSFAARDTFVYGVRENRFVYARDLYAATNLFERDLGTFTISPLMLYGNTLFISGADGFIHMVDRGSGSVVLRAKVNDGLVSDIRIANGGTNLILRNSMSANTRGAGRSFGSGYARAGIAVSGALTISGADNGAVTIISNTTNIIGVYKASNAVTGSMLVYGGKTVFVDGSGVVYCITNTGSLLWRYTNTVDIIPNPALYGSGNQLVFAARSGELVSLYLSTGTVKYKTNAGLPFATPPTIARDRVLIGTTNGMLSMFVLSNGMRITNIALPGVPMDEIAVCDRGMVAALSDGRVCLVRNSYETTMPPDMIAVNGREAPYVDLRNDLLSWRFRHTDLAQMQKYYQYQFAKVSNFKTLYYDSGKVTSASTNITLATSVTDGIYFVRVRTWDTNDRPGFYSPGTNRILVDRTRPVVSVKYTAGTVTNVPAATNVVTNAAVTVYISAYDLTNQSVCSGISNRCYTTNGSVWYTNGVFPVVMGLSDGIAQTFTYTSLDNAGNAAVTNKFVMIRDNTPPAAVLSADPITFPGPSTVYCYTTTKFTVSASDAHSGQRAVYFAVDAGAFIGRTSNVTTNFYLSEGAHTIRYFALDNLSNYSTTNSMQFTVLNASSDVVRSTTMKTPFITASSGYTNIAFINEHYLVYYNDPVRNGVSLEVPLAAPVMMMAAAAPAQPSAYISVGTFSPSVEVVGINDGGRYTPGVSASASDPSAEMLLNGSAYVPGTAITMSGQHVLTALLKSQKSVLASASVRFTVDGTAPTIRSDCTSPVQAKPFSVVLSADEPTGYYSIDGAPFTSFAASTSVRVDKKMSLRYFGKDDLGNTSTLNTVILAVDAYPPVISVDITNNGVYAAGIVPRISASDENLLDRSVLLDGSAYSDTPILGGTHTLEVRASDLAGNCAVKTVRFFADGSAPDIIISGAENNASYTRDVSLSVVIRDESLRAASVILISPDGATRPLSAGKNGYTAAVSAEGDHQIHAEAEDAAGNRSIKDIRFSIDRTLPVVVVTGAADGGNYTRADVNVRVYEKDLDQANSIVTMTFLSNTVFGGEWRSLTDENSLAYAEKAFGMITNAGAYRLSHDVRDRAGNRVTNAMSFAVRSFIATNDLSLYAPFDVSTAAVRAGGDKNDYSGVRILMSGGYSSNCVAPGIASGDVVVQYRAQSNISARKGTLAFWVKPAWETPDTAGNYLFTLYDSSIAQYALSAYVTRTNGMTYSVRNAAGTVFSVSSTNWRGMDWTHLSFAWDFDAGTSAVYANGKQIAQVKMSGSPRSDAYWICLAAGVAKHGWVTLKGRMDEARVYSRSLNADEVSSLYSLYADIAAQANAAKAVNAGKAQAASMSFDARVLTAPSMETEKVIFEERTGKE